jgi:thioredoxin reductase (NADPH)
LRGAGNTMAILATEVTAHPPGTPLCLISEVGIGVPDRIVGVGDDRLIGGAHPDSLVGTERPAETFGRDPALSASMSQYLIDQIEAAKNISVRYETSVTAAAGADHLERLTLTTHDGTSSEVEASALFVFIGMAPRTEWVDGLVERDERGFIVAGADLGPQPRGWAPERAPLPLETSVPGVFVAGDVRASSIKRVASAVGEGAMAVRFVHDHLASR